MKYNQHAILRSVGICFALLGLAGAIGFSIPAKINRNPAVWLMPDYYGQFLPIAISVMLLVCGAFLTFESRKANFNLAVFGHTASEEALFSWIGWTKSALPPWAITVFFVLSLFALGIAYSNVLKQKRLSVAEALFGICFGALLILLPKFF